MKEVRPYEGEEAKKKQIRTMFDRIAFRYDFLNRLLSLGVDVGWRKGTVRMVAEDRPSSILDLAAGTGDLTLMLARRIPQAAVTGVDLAPEMLEVGRRKIVKSGVRNIRGMVEGDAEALPFEAGSFDAVTVGFGVRNFGNIPVGLSEMYRVLRPGGRVYILEFGMPERRIFGALYRFYFRRLLPFIGGIFSGEHKAYRYLQRSVEEFPYGDRFVALMREAGFTRVSHRPLTEGLASIYRGEKEGI
jgi:demethylmenaquinone methyltransferase/2-methoxy-6-polyprenyl-1,4-benzoquinol methylase